MHRLLTGGDPAPRSSREGELRRAPGAADAPAERGEDLPGRGGGPVLACKLCFAAVTSRGEAVEVDGSHEHTFFNPAGVLFEIGCFAAAPGCAVTGDPTEEFTWFPGFRWSFASCLGCGAHLGWRFVSAAGTGFFGLIQSRLVEMERDEGAA